jgi:hypothetical protein
MTLHEEAPAFQSVRYSLPTVPNGTLSCLAVLMDKPINIVVGHMKLDDRQTLGSSGDQLVQITDGVSLGRRGGFDFGEFLPQSALESIESSLSAHCGHAARSRLAWHLAH